MDWNGSTLDIRLQVSDRPGSHLIAWVFKLFLREMYGYSNTSLVTLPDRFSMDDYLEVMSDCPRSVHPSLCSRSVFRIQNGGLAKETTYLKVPEIQSEIYICTSEEILLRYWSRKFLGNLLRIMSESVLTSSE